MATSKTSPTTFTATLIGEGGKCGFVIPESVIVALDAGKRPPVLVNINGYEYRYTVAVMGGEYLIGVNKDHREATGLKSGDEATVTLTVDSSPREVPMPPDFASALAAKPAAQKFFDALSNSLQRYHVGNIESAKTEETRQKRIVKAVDLFLSGKQR